MTDADRDSGPLLEYVAGSGTRDGAGWTNSAGERLDTIDKLAEHLKAADAAAAANGH